MASPPALIWLALALCSAVSLGLYEVARKAAVERNAVLPVLLAANIGGLALLLGTKLVLQVFPTVGEGLSFSVLPLSSFEHALVLGKSVLVSSSWVCAYFAVKHLPISIAAPLRSLSPMVTVVGALVLFGETPTPLQLLGMGIIFGGYLGFAWLGRAEGIHFHKSPWVLLLLLGTFLGALSGLYDKHLLQHHRLHPTTLQLWFTVWNTFIFGLLTAALFRPQKTSHAFVFKWTIPAVGAALVVADQFYFRALSEPGAMVSVIALVRRTSVVVSFILGGLLFREKLLRRKGAFLAVILVGVSLLFLESVTN